MHQTNRQHRVPLMDLTHINEKKHNTKIITTVNTITTNNNTNNNNRYRIDNNNTNNIKQTAENNIIIRRNPKLSDETLMKLPHLRKHRDYIRQMDTAMGPKDYYSYRVSVNSTEEKSLAMRNAYVCYYFRCI